MAKYVYKHSDLWIESRSILEKELEELASWLHSSKIDEDFEVEEHTYTDSETGDVLLFIPEMTNSQLFAASIILSSSELYFDNKPARLAKPPVTAKDLMDEDGTVY